MASEPPGLTPEVRDAREAPYIGFPYRDHQLAGLPAGLPGMPHSIPLANAPIYREPRDFSRLAAEGVPPFFSLTKPGQEFDFVKALNDIPTQLDHLK